MKKFARLLGARIGMVIFSLLLLFALLELGSVLILARRDGEWPTYRSISAQQTNTYLENLINQDCVYHRSVEPHPYVAWTLRENLPCGVKGLNAIGLDGPDMPWKKEPGVITILVLGGSVAHQQGVVPREEGLEYLLNKRYGKNGRPKIRVVYGALAAWKQPQTFIFFSLYANQVDAVVTIDGFNEHMMFRSSVDTRLEEPADYFYRNAENSTSPTRFFALRVDGALARWHDRNTVAQKSFFVHLATSTLRGVARRIAVGAVDEDKRLGSSRFHFPGSMSVPERYAYNLELYRKYIRMMNWVARPLGVRTLHLIQPFPGVDKKLTAEELKVTHPSPEYAADYAKLRDSLLELNKEGIPVASLTGIFRGMDETLYEDEVHMIPRGRRILTGSIIDEMDKHWSKLLR